MSATSDYTAKDGRVFIRGVAHTEQTCARLLELHQRDAASGQYFAPWSAQSAAELEAAMADAAWQQHQQEAA